MTKQEMIKVAEEIQDLTAFLDEIKAEIETKQDLLKAQMAADGLEVLDLDTFYVRWLPVISNRLDSTKMKKDLPDLYKSYLKAVHSRRFTITAA